MKALQVHLTGLVANTVVFALIGVALNVGLGMLQVSPGLSISALAISGLMLGAMVSLGGGLITLLARRTPANAICFSLACAFTNLAIFYAMSKAEFGTIEPVALISVAAYGLISGLLASAITRLIHRKTT